MNCSMHAHAGPGMKEHGSISRQGASRAITSRIVLCRCELDTAQEGNPIDRDDIIIHYLVVLLILPILLNPDVQWD